MTELEELKRQREELDKRIKELELDACCKGRARLSPIRAYHRRITRNISVLKVANGFESWVSIASGETVKEATAGAKIIARDLAALVEELEKVHGNVDAEDAERLGNIPIDGEEAQDGLS